MLASIVQFLHAPEWCFKIPTFPIQLFMIFDMTKDFKSIQCQSSNSLHSQIHSNNSPYNVHKLSTSDLQFFSNVKQIANST